MTDNAQGCTFSVEHLSVLTVKMYTFLYVQYLLKELHFYCWPVNKLQYNVTVM